MTVKLPTARLLPRRKRAPNAAPMSNARFLDSTSQTLAQIQYRKLHSRIISMELPPGTPISEAELANQEGVSRTPIREAVLRLARERLVEVVPKSGTFVARIPVSALPEAMVARRALECMTAKSAAKNATRSQVLLLQAQIEEQRELGQKTDLQAFHQADEEFHEQIAMVGRLPGLWQLAQQVKQQIDRFRHLTLPEAGRLSMVVKEHSDVVEAIGRKDYNQAYEAMDFHLTGLQQHIEAVVNAHPGYFIHDADLNDLVQI